MALRLIAFISTMLFIGLSLSGIAPEIAFLRSVVVFALLMFLYKLSLLLLGVVHGFDEEEEEETTDEDQETESEDEDERSEEEQTPYEYINEESLNEDEAAAGRDEAEKQPEQRAPQQEREQPGEAPSGRQQPEPSATDENDVVEEDLSKYSDIPGAANLAQDIMSEGGPDISSGTDSGEEGVPEEDEQQA